MVQPRLSFVTAKFQGTGAALILAAVTTIEEMRVAVSCILDWSVMSRKWLDGGSDLGTAQTLTLIYVVQGLLVSTCCNADAASLLTQRNLGA